MTEARVHSINVSNGGVPKQPRQSASIRVGGVEGDRQKDLRHHGGPDRAVLLYSLERIEALRQEGHPIEPGSIGENVTLSGLDWPSLKPGVRLEVGDALLEIVKPADPCQQIAGSFLKGEFVRVSEKVHPGWSRLCSRVLREGGVKVGDRATVTPSAAVENRFTGLLLGTAVGDSLGLPVENLSPRRRRRLFGPEWRHRLLPGMGLVSDDTEHAFFTAQALLAHPEDERAFARALAWSVRLWILGVPAGVGFATLRSALKLWCLFPPEKSGVWSAGNGPAMRAPVVGAFHASDRARRDAFVRASTLLTHTDPRALSGALAVAEAAAWAVGQSGERQDAAALVGRLREVAVPGDDEWAGIVSRLDGALERGDSVPAFAASLGLEGGVTGYVHHTVPVVLYALLHHRGAFEATLESVLECGGDADTTAAIAGALAGALSGSAAIPERWLQGVVDWPLSVRTLRAAGRSLAARHGGDPSPGPVRWLWPLLPLRNLVLLAAVLAHGLRRMLPPY